MYIFHYRIPSFWFFVHNIVFENANLTLKQMHIGNNNSYQYGNSCNEPLNNHITTYISLLQKIMLDDLWFIFNEITMTVVISFALSTRRLYLDVYKNCFWYIVIRKNMYWIYNYLQFISTWTVVVIGRDRFVLVAVHVNSACRKERSMVRNFISFLTVPFLSTL